jgi:hypothetical protein
MRYDPNYSYGDEDDESGDDEIEEDLEEEEEDEFSDEVRNGLLIVAIVDIVLGQAVR